MKFLSDLKCDVYLVVLILDLIVKQGLENETFSKVQLLKLIHILHELIVLDALHELIMHDVLSLCFVPMLKRVNDLKHPLQLMFLLCLYFKCLHVMILRSVLLLFMRHLCWRISLDQFFDITVINMRSLHFEQLVKPILLLCRR